MFVFYDTETTGTDLDFSQILQIGLLFTDDDMNILASKKLDCRVSPWVVPSPGALLTTGFTPDDLKSSKSSNYEMMQEINTWLHGQHWPVTFIGYNSINYDEPVLSENLYQNMLDPALTTSGNDTSDKNNGRADIMYLVQAAALYMPGALKLDELNYYKLPSMTLKSVARQNGVALSDEDAHDALNDIKATVGVAKVIKKAAPQIWDQMMSLSTIKGVEDFLASHKIFTYVNADHYDETTHKPMPMQASVVTSLGGLAGTTSEMLYDLRFDPKPYLNMTVDELKEIFLETDHSHKALGLISREKQPMLMPMEQSGAVLTEKDDPAVFNARAKAVMSNKQFLGRVAEAAALARREMKAAALLPSKVIDLQVTNPDVRAKLQDWISDFNKAGTPKDRYDMSEKFGKRFEKELEEDSSLWRFRDVAKMLISKVTVPFPATMLDEEFTPAARRKLETWIAEFRAAGDWHERTRLLETFHGRFAAEDLAASASLKRFEKAAGSLVYEHAVFTETDVQAPIAPAAQQKVQQWAKEFNEAPDWHARAVMVSGFREHFKEELKQDVQLDRFVKLAGRIVFEHAPGEFAAETQLAMKQFIAGRILNPDLNVPYMTVAKARKELDNIEWQRARPGNKKWTEVTDSQIRSLKLYYTALEKEYAPYSPYKPGPANSNTPSSSIRRPFNKPGPRA